MIPPHYNTTQAAEALGVQERVIRSRIKAGKLKATKVDGRGGGEWRIAEADIKKYLEGKKA
jgi:excisionase family DNA binding protein